MYFLEMATSGNYSNEGFDIEVWAAREKLSEEIVHTLYREKITSFESISRLEESDIKDLGLPIGERVLLRGAVRNLTTLQRRSTLSTGRPAAAPVRRTAPTTPGKVPVRQAPAPPPPPPPGLAELTISQHSPTEPDYETIPYDRVPGVGPNESFLGNWSKSDETGPQDGYSRVGGEAEPYYANYTNTESDYMVASALLQKTKRRAPPPPPGSPTGQAPGSSSVPPGSPALPLTKSKSAPPPPGSPSGRPSSGKGPSYVTLSKVATQPGEDKCACLDEPTFNKEVQYGYLTRADVNNALKRYSTLQPKFDIYDKPQGSPELRLCLDGTIPFVHKGLPYRLPVQIWLDKGHPYQAPAVRVIPSTDMRINPNAYVNAEGVVSIGFLKRWKHPTSDILGLVDNLTKSFNQASPVYAKLPPRT